MKILVLAAFTFLASIAHAAPAVFSAYCMVPKFGKAPGRDIQVAYGTATDVITLGDLTYAVGYRESLGEKNVLQLIVFNHVTKKQSVTEVFIENEFPRRVSLVSALGSLTCFRN